MFLGPRNVFPIQGIYKEFMYADVFTLSGTTSLTSTGTPTVFLMNDLYGPLYSGGGTSHQPYWWDQIKGLYGQYQVFEFGWQITMFDASTTSLFGVVSTTSSTDSAYTIGTTLPINCMERPGCEVKLIGGAENNNSSVSFSGRVKIWEVEGLKYQQWLADNNYRAAIGANPVRLPKLSIAVGDLAAANPSGSCRCMVKLYFKAKLWCAETQGQS